MAVFDQNKETPVLGSYALHRGEIHEPIKTIDLCVSHPLIGV